MLCAAVVVYAGLALPRPGWATYRWLLLGFAVVIAFKLSAPASAPPLGLKASYFPGATSTGRPSARPISATPSWTTRRGSTRPRPPRRGLCRPLLQRRQPFQFRRRMSSPGGISSRSACAGRAGCSLPPTASGVLSSSRPAGPGLARRRPAAGQRQPSARGCRAAHAAGGLHAPGEARARAAPQLGAPARRAAGGGGRARRAVAAERRCGRAEPPARPGRRSGCSSHSSRRGWHRVRQARRSAGLVRAALGVVPLIFLANGMLLLAPLAGRVTILSGL